MSTITETNTDTDTQPNPTTPEPGAQTPVPVTGNLLVHYTTQRTGLSVTHKRITNENCGKTGANPKALRTVAKLFESKGTAIGQILSLFAQTRADIAKLGLRLSTGGHLVRADKLEQVNEIFDNAEDQLERLRGQLRRDYPGLVTKSKLQLGTAANDIEFPSAEVAASKFAHQLDLAPDPTSGGILLEGVSEEVAARVRAKVEESRESVLQDAQAGLIKELLGFVTGSCETDQGIIGVLGSDCVVRRSRFDRLKERLEAAKDYNWIGSVEFDNAISTLEPIANADLDEIRGDEDKRRELEVQTKKAVKSVTEGSLAALGLST